MATPFQGFRGGTLIITGTITATGLTVLNQLLQGEIQIRPIISGFIVGTILLVTAFWSVEVAAALTLLILVTSILVNAPAILVKVTNRD